MTRQKALKRLVRFIQPALQGLALERSRCVMTTAIGVDVLAALGIDAAPLSVTADLVNREYVDWMTAGHPGGEAGGLAAGAWRLTTGDPSVPRPARTNALVPEPRKPWDGHLVVEVPAVRTILDLDLQQMNRPQKNIRVPDAAAFEWDGGEGIYTLPGGLGLRYRARRDDLSWVKAPDWVHRKERWADLVAGLVRQIRKGDRR